MPTDRTKSLRRFAQTANLLYKIETRELAQINAARRELRERHAGAQAYLDASLGSSELLNELAIASAVRLRKKLVEIEAQHAGQMDSTIGSMAKAKGAMARLEAEIMWNNEVAAKRTLDELIEAIIVNNSA